MSSTTIATAPADDSDGLSSAEYKSITQLEGALMDKFVDDAVYRIIKRNPKMLPRLSLLSRAEFYTQLRAYEEKLSEGR